MHLNGKNCKIVEDSEKVWGYIDVYFYNLQRFSSLITSLSDPLHN